MDVYQSNAVFNPIPGDPKDQGLMGCANPRTLETTEQSVAGFLKAAGRDYYIQRIAATHPRLTDDDGKPVIIDGQFHLLRSDTSQVVSPHTVTDQYAPMSLVDIAEEIEPWCQAGWATPDSVFGHRILPDGGESLELLFLRLDAGEELKKVGETFRHYLVITNPHAAGGKAQGKIIDWRPSCSNMFAAVVSAGFDFAIPHRIGRKADPAEVMKERQQAAVAGWANAQAHIRQLADRIAVYQDFGLSESEALALTDDLLGISGKKEEDISTRAGNKRSAIMGGFSNSEAATGGENLWDWINGVTWYTSSPKALENQKSKVTPDARIVRNVDPNGSGLGVEKRARALADRLIAAGQ